jgi:hypothetical protein
MENLDWIGEEVADPGASVLRLVLRIAMKAHGEDPDDPQLWKDRLAQVGYSLNSRLTS